MPMPVRLRAQEIRWRCCRKLTGVPRSSASLPKTCRKGSYGEWTEEKRSVTVRQHFVLLNARLLSHHVSLSFIVQEGSLFTSLTIYLPNITTQDSLCTYFSTIYIKGRARVKSRFSRVMHRLRSGTVFFTTSAPT